MHQGTLSVEAYSRDDQTKLATGKLLTIDNQIDQTTGTGRLKALFDNPGRRSLAQPVRQCSLAARNAQGKYCDSVGCGADRPAGKLCIYGETRQDGRRQSSHGFLHSK